MKRSQCRSGCAVCCEQQMRCSNVWLLEVSEGVGDIACHAIVNLFCLCVCQTTETNRWRPQWPVSACGAGHGDGVEAGVVTVGGALTTGRSVVLSCLTRWQHTAPMHASMASMMCRRTTEECAMRQALRFATLEPSTLSAVHSMSAGSFSSDVASTQLVDWLVLSSPAALCYKHLMRSLLRASSVLQLSVTGNVNQTRLWWQKV